MIEKLTAFFKQFATSFNQLKTVQKVIALTVALTLVVFIVFTANLSSQDEYVYLFQKPLSIKDYGLISSELQKMNEDFKVMDDRYLLVKDEKTGSRIRMSLAQNNLLPQGIKGWELFDMESWTTTEFDRNVKLRRAIEGEIKRHLEILNWIDNVEISIAIPEKSLYTERDKDVTAAVTIRPAEGFYDYLKKKKMIKGIKNIIAKGIDGINIDNIVITDHNGNELSNFLEDDYEKNIKQAIEENKVKDKEIRKIKNKIEQSLSGVLSLDRFRVAVELEINFNRKSVNQKEVLPIVIKERTPGLAYDDSVIRDTLKISSKTLDEKFEGLGFIPEGPPGVEDNIPPGYKESLDGRNKFTKKEEINNFINGEKIIKHVEDASEVERKSVSVSVDGYWETVHDEDGNLIIENNSIKRKYIPLKPEYIKKLEDVVKGAISYNVKRGDVVMVKNISFDRINEFKIKDEAIIKNMLYRKLGLYTILSLFSLVIVYLIYRLIVRYIKDNIERKKRESAELARLRRNQILSDLDSAETTDFAKLEDDDKRHIQLQEKIHSLIRQEPASAAKVLSVWIKETN